MILLPGDLPITGSQMASLALLLLALLLLPLLAARFRTGRRPRIRPLQVFDELPAELGRSAEDGRPLHFAIGSGGIGGDRTLTSLAALEILQELAANAVAYGTPPIVTVGDPTLLPLAEDALRRAYVHQGIPEQYNPTSVRFIGIEPAVYAAGAAGETSYEKSHGNIIAGAFEEEVALVAHAGEVQQIPQMVALDQLRALGAVFPSEGPMAVGEELYAGMARLADSPAHLASLRVQDILRFLLLVAILLKALGLF